MTGAAGGKTASAPQVRNRTSEREVLYKRRANSIPEGREDEDDYGSSSGTDSSTYPPSYKAGSRTSTTCAHIQSIDHIRLANLDGDDGIEVICVGLMRTGLKTLHKALRNLGYSNIYDQEDIAQTYELWDDVLRNKATQDTFAQIFEGSKVIMGMPTFCFWEQIVELYPNARVILTVRDEDEWWESVQRAKKLMLTELPGAPMRYGSKMRSLERFLMPSYHKFCDVLRFSWATALGAHGLEDETLNEAMARSNYRRHNTYVESCLMNARVASGEPRLLIYDVRQGWEPLCKFLGADWPQVEFPSVMHVPYFPGQKDAGVDDDGRAKDDGQCFEAILLPDSDFGVKMRKELRKGLAMTLAGLTLFVMAVIGVCWTQAIDFPRTTVGFAYLTTVTIAWNVYLVMHGLVLKVPALVVLPMAMKSLLIALSLHGCFITYGILKEILVVHDKIASPVLVLSSRLMSIVCGCVVLYLQQGSLSFGAPIRDMGKFAFTNEAATWAGYEMLKYVSFPIQVMAKSVKMLPSMIMGRIVNKTQYSFFQYVQAVVALVCVAVMHMSEGHGDSPRAGRTSKVVEDDSSNPYYKTVMGIVMLLIYFACDSFTSQWQNALYKKHPKLSQTQMMLGGNFLGLVLTSGTLFAARHAVMKSMGVIAAQPEVLGRIALLGVVYAVGQFCIYSAIRILGPLSFTWIMTARQLISVLISLVYFGNGVGLTQGLCILVVFGIMSAKQLTKAMPKSITRHLSRILLGQRAQEPINPISPMISPVSRVGKKDM
mmetsp:Transcript_9361/g.24166  ORF Transcript_9361/g.24166 Transcript_9361/m.24166 type:complete len:770 (-) Transcript_9361:292-2601(-)